MNLRHNYFIQLIISAYALSSNKYLNLINCQSIPRGHELAGLGRKASSEVVLEAGSGVLR
ncbi:MAG: hypothetical protein AAFN00_18935 [Cyanobacteria bacterium J06558_2]